MKLSETVKNINVEVQKNPNINQAIQSVREQLVESKVLPKEQSQKVDRALTEAQSLVKQGRVTAGKNLLSQALTETEAELRQIENRQPTQQTQVSNTSEPRPSETVKNIKAETQQEPDLQKAVEKVRDQVVNNPKIDREVAQRVGQAVKEAVSLQRVGQELAGRERLQQALAKAEVELKQVESRQLAQQAQAINSPELRPSEVVKNVRSEVQKEPDIQKAVEKVRDQVVNNPKIDREVAQKVDQALKEMVSLQKVGQEIAGRDRLQQALAKAEVELKQVESRQPAQQAQASNITQPRPSEVVKNVKAEVQKEPDIQKAVEKVRDQVVNNPRVDREVAQKVDQALKETVSLQKVGQEVAGRDRLQQALAKAEVELRQVESRQSVQQPAQTANVTDPRPSETVKNVRVETQQEPDLQKAVEKVRDQVVNNPKIDREVAQKVDQALKETVSLQRVGQEIAGRDRLQQALAKAEVELRQVESRQPAQQVQAPNVTEPRSSEVVKNVRSEVQQEPDLQKVVEKVRDQVVNNPRVDREVAQKVDQALKETVSLQRVGQESVGRDRLQQALTKAEVELKQLESRQPAQQAQVSNSTEPRPSEVVKNVRSEVQQEPDLQKAVEKVRDQVVNNPRVDREVAQKVDQALKETVSLQRVGQEIAGRDRLQQALAKAEVELRQVESRQPAQQVQAPNVTEPRPSEVVKNVKAEVQQEPSLQKAVEKVRDQVVNNPKIDREVAQKVDQALKETVSLQKVGQELAGRDGLQQALAKAEVELRQVESRQLAQQTQATNTIEPRPSEVVKNVRTEVQQEPVLQKAVEKVREQVVNNPKVDREVAQKVDQALKETVSLQRIGQEPVGRDRLQQALAKAEVELKQVENRQPVQQTQAPNATTEPRPSEVVKNVRSEVQQEPDIQKAVERVRDQVVNNPKVDREVAQKVEQALKETVSLQRIGQESVGRDRLQQALAKAEVELKQVENRQPVQQTQAPNATTDPRSSEVVKNVRSEVQQEPDIQKAVERVRDQVVNNPKVDREVAQKVDQALKETVSLQRIGQESVGRDRLQQALAKAEVELKQVETRQPAQQTQATNATTEPRPSETVKNVRTEIQQEPNLQKAIEKVRDQIINNPKINQEVMQKVEQSVREATILQKVGQEPAGRNRLVQALANAEADLKRTEPAQQQTQQANPTQEQSVRESIKQVREEIQATTDTKKVMQKVQDLAANLKNVDPETARNIERFASQATQLDQAGRERLSNMLRQVETAIKQTEAEATKTTEPTAKQPEAQLKGQGTNQNANNKVQAEAMKPQQSNATQQQNVVGQQNPVQDQESAQQPKLPEIRPSETMKQALNMLRSEPDLEQALSKIQKEVAGNPNIDLKTIDKVEKAIDGAQQLQDKGREIAARQQLTNELTNIEQDLVKSEPKTSPEQQALKTAEQYDVNEMLQSLNIASKDILVTKVTQKLAQATHDFRELKREITRNLDSVERVINTFKKNAYPHAKQMLETAISKLDNAILKSEMMLFTDMKTEKQLMQASGQLAEAKKLLAKGDHAEASKIVHNVKNLVDKLIFKPSEQKIMHYVNKESMMMEQKSPSQQMLSQFSEAAQSATRGEPSARQMYEMVRSLGLNHESEVANNLVFHKNDQIGREQQQEQNLKAALLKLMQSEGQEARTPVSQQAEQALNNLTGQQLLSKSDASGSLQSMFFNLPLLLGGKPENLQVFINSKNEGQQVEWENCNLYFLLETKKLGDVGILLNSVDRNLSITIKNDLPGFKEKMEPIVEMTKGKLQEVGYNVTSINFAKMNPIQEQVTAKEVENEIDQARTTRQIFNERGLNFTI